MADPHHPEVPRDEAAASPSPGSTSASDVHGRPIPAAGGGSGTGAAQSDIHDVAAPAEATEPATPSAAFEPIDGDSPSPTPSGGEADSETEAGAEADAGEMAAKPSTSLSGFFARSDFVAATFGETEAAAEHEPAEGAHDAEFAAAALAQIGAGGAAPTEGAAELHAGTVPGPVAPAPRAGGGVLIYTWASLATILALWLWWTRPERIGHLENLPDDGSLKAGAKESSFVDPREKLSSSQYVRLGETRRFGDLEVTPTGIEFRHVRQGDGRKVFARPRVLTLTLKVRNVATKTSFHPFDPRFLRLVERGEGRTKKPAKLGKTVVFDNGYTYTFAHPEADVVSIDKRILPYYDLNEGAGERIHEQQYPLLAPGESADGLIVSEEECLDKVGERMLWRVKLRKGLLQSGRGVATVIAVPFGKSDVRISDEIKSTPTL